MVDHEFKVLPTKRFATDEAIEAVIEEDNGKVVFALEYKPKVSSDLNDQAHSTSLKRYFRPSI